MRGWTDRPRQRARSKCRRDHPLRRDDHL